MAGLNSFKKKKKDAFLSSQIVQVGNNQTPNQRAAEGHYLGKRAGRHFFGEQREARERPGVFTVLTPPVIFYFVLF